MNYDEMSDFDISRRVAESVDLYWHMNPSHRLNHSGTWCYGEEPKDKSRSAVSLPDYCDSWADAGPIIVENKIATHWARGDEWKAICTNQGMPGAFYRAEAWSVSPLRAAMIVFLKMKEGE